MARVDTKSHWRLAARKVINEVLATLPPDASLTEKKAALRTAYPFAERMGFAYKAWLTEVRLALGAGKVKPPERYEVRFVLSGVSVGPDCLPGGSPWLDVDCGWCGNRQEILEWFLTDAGGRDCRRGVVGCFMCAASRERLKAVVALPQWHAFRDAARDGDAVAVAVAKDWLTDLGIVWEEAAAHPSHKKRRTK